MMFCEAVRRADGALQPQRWWKVRNVPKAHGHYFCTTGVIARPPTLLCTAAEVNGPVTVSCSEYFPVPTNGMFPTKAPVIALNTCSVATLSELLTQDPISRPR